MRASDRARAAVGDMLHLVDLQGIAARDRIMRCPAREFAALVLTTANQRVAELVQGAMVRAVGEFGRALGAEFSAAGMACECAADMADVTATTWKGRRNEAHVFEVGMDAFGEIARGTPAEAATATLERRYGAVARTMLEAALGDAWRRAARDWTDAVRAAAGEARRGDR